MTTSGALHAFLSLILDDSNENAAVQSETQTKLKYLISKVNSQVRLTASQVSSLLVVKQYTERDGLFISNCFG